MSLYDYQRSKKIADEEPSFAILIMAAAWKADTDFEFLKKGRGSIHRARKTRIEFIRPLH